MQQLSEIKAELARQNLLMIELITPHDYPSLKEHIVNLELREALDQLETMLASPETFEAAFQTHCNGRAIRNQNTLLDFSVTPSHQTNILYWNIARILFPSAKQKDMVRILLPQVTSVVHLELPDSLPTNLSIVELKKAMKALRPIPIRKPLVECDTEISPNGLEDFVISDQIIFDVRELSHYRYDWQASLHDALHQDFPELAQTLYAHNHTLHMLQDDILLLKHHGKAPRIAIENLVHGLQLGGQRFTGNMDAGMSAQIAYEVFFTYWNTLPESLCATLEALSGEGTNTLKHVLHSLKHGSCVETAAFHLQVILSNNKSAAELNTSPSLTDAEINDIKRKYNQLARSGFNTRKSSKEHKTLPPHLLKPALRAIGLDSIEDWLSLLLSFQPEMYGDLFEFVDLTHMSAPFKHLFSVIGQGFFNAEQCAGLGAGISRHPNILENIDELFIAIVDTKSVEMLARFMTIDTIQRISLPTKIIALKKVIDDFPFLITMLEKYTESERLELVLALFDSVHPSVNALKSIFSLLTEPQREQVLAKPFGDYKITLLRSAAHDPEQLRFILSCYPREQRLEVLKQSDAQGNTLLFSVCQKIDAFHVVIECYPEEQRLEIIKQRNLFGYTALSKAAPSDSELLKLLLTFYPQEQQFNAIHSEPFLLSTSFRRADSIHTILTAYPREQRIQAILDDTKWGGSMLLYHGYAAESLKTTFELLPESHRLNALTKKDIVGMSILNNMHQNPQLLNIALTNLPEIDRLEAFKQCIQSREFNGIAMLEAVVRQSGLLKQLFIHIPESDRLDALKVKNSKGKMCLNYLESCTIVIELLPRSSILSAIREINGNGTSILSYAADKPALVKTILTRLPEEQRLTALRIQRSNQCSPLGFIESLKVAFELLPESQRIQAVQRNHCEEGWIQGLADYPPNYFETILELLPETQRIDALKEENDDGLNVLERATNVCQLLALLPESDRANALMNRRSVLRALSNHPSQLIRALELVPETQRFFIIVSVTPPSFGLSLLLRPAAISGDFESVKTILSFYPESERLGALTNEALFEPSILNYMRDSLNFKSLTTLLELLPKHQHLDALQSMRIRNSAVNFLLKFEVMKLKANEFIEKSQNNPAYVVAAHAATILVASIDQYQDDFISDGDYETFKHHCIQAIDESRSVLETHRGWKQILGNLALAMIGLGILYAGAVLYNKCSTGNYLFFKTDSAEKLDDLSMQLNRLQRFN